MSALEPQHSSDIMVPLDRVYVINEHDFVIDWGDQRVESLTDGRYFPAPAIESRHEISQYELEQLQRAGYINGYDDHFVFLDVHAVTYGHEQQRQYYLHTRLTKDYRADVEGWLQLANLSNELSVRVQRNFVIIRGKSGLGFPALETALAAQARIVRQVPQLAQTVVAFIEVLA
ncbi:MAG: hypothetical protein KC615_07215 [Anaerolineae bacterium]|nr:hypothetical protein [Anaerolineae bacterium]MCA9892757.1 hypothetical protein [Anaerolineae bacterium]